ncbi:UvrB/UvrC motif-containing protein [Tepidibacter formicigenes]|jgi:protein arginine kinase activator|uniref:Protein-arginine kinase activator protein McsA n=1 Tax=Tepidibacter formicigenes DSM 15518 TaxID=1123349 RepID=A0A1M6QM32_9FIRM|nr:UvrB/UvrC motif-containing protein [Tepidibacter formicigenes]SHK21301.1 Protein-arginine kinase activator protein McsA [Tepidibacter formicigenes DSM 15518]
MICEKCNQKEATIHLTEIINGKKREIHICEDCANKEKSMSFNMDFDTPFSMKDILSSVIDMGINNDFYKVEEVICSECKGSYRRFKNIGRLGCNKCYDTFKEQLTPVIKRIQGSTDHIGKVPKKIGGSLRIKNEIKRLKKELNEAVGKEEFERAAKLRDKIKELEKQI